MQHRAAIRGALCAALGFLSALTLNAGPASAQTHSWVSKASGSSDANPCSRAAPCLTFAAAYGKTAAGGQIDVLDAGDYGALTITKALTIDGGGMGTVVSANGNLFVVAAGASDVVTIRNITLQGLQGATNGIEITTAGKVNIDHVIAAGFTGNGILDARSNSGGYLFVSDSIVRNNGNGLWMQPSGGSINAVVRRVQAASNATGIATWGTETFVSIRDSTAVGNTFGVTTMVGGEINLENCGLYSNGTGVLNGQLGPATIRLSNTTVMENSAGVSNSAGSLLTYGNNRIGGAPQTNSAMTPASPPLE